MSIVPSSHNEFVTGESKGNSDHYPDFSTTLHIVCVVLNQVFFFLNKPLSSLPSPILIFKEPNASINMGTNFKSRGNTQLQKIFIMSQHLLNKFIQKPQSNN